MAQFQRIICKDCGKPLFPAIKNGQNTVLKCDCPAGDREIRDVERGLKGGDLQLGPIEDDGQ